MSLTGCGDNQDPSGSLALWQKISELQYQNFVRAPGYETRQPSVAPHGDQVDIYINSIVDDALKAGTPITSWPTGSLIIKDGFKDDGEQELVAVMEKQETGWYWAEYFDLENGEAQFSGSPDACTGCHSSGADFVRAFGFP